MNNEKPGFVLLRTFPCSKISQIYIISSLWNKRSLLNHWREEVYRILIHAPKPNLRNSSNGLGTPSDVRSCWEEKLGMLSVRLWIKQGVLVYSCLALLTAQWTWTCVSTTLSQHLERSRLFSAGRLWKQCGTSSGGLAKRGRKISRIKGKSLQLGDRAESYVTI